MSSIIIPERHRADAKPQAPANNGVAQLVESPQLEANELIIARLIAETLHKHYPGHLWAVAVEENRLIIKDLYLSGEWGFVLFLTNVYSISSLIKDAVRAGGEILERYRQARSGMRVEDIAALPTDFSGRHKHEE